jgi:hypothetical protein
MKAKITRDTFISGTPVKKGDIVEVDEQTFRILVQYGKAESVKPEPKKAN